MDRLLIVHDHEFTQERMRRAAIKAGFGEDDIDVARSYEKAAAILAEGSTYLIALIDINLIDCVDGLGVKLIRELRDSMPDCKVIAVSKVKETKPFADTIDAGAHDFVGEEWRGVDFDALLTQK